MLGKKITTQLDMPEQGRRTRAASERMNLSTLAGYLISHAGEHKGGGKWPFRLHLPLLTSQKARYVYGRYAPKGN